MPLLAEFSSLKFWMYWEDNSKHKMPHIHVKTGEYEAVYDFYGRKIAGKLPMNKYKVVKDWIQGNQQVLCHLWLYAVANNNSVDFKIGPFS